MKNRCSNWQIAVAGILIFAVCLAALPVYAQTKPDGKGVGLKVVSELPSKEKRWALIVGIDEYQNDVSTLKGSVNDAKALKNVLVNNAGFPDNQIILLTTDSAEQDKRPTRENILRALRDLHNRLDEESLLLFSFSGHGISIDNQAFLIPSNGSFTKNISLLEDFSIDVSRIKRAIQEIKVKQVLMLIDACRNQPGKGDTPNKLTEAYKNGFAFDVANSDVKAFATLYATSVGDRAYEFYDKDTKQFRGYFSYAVEEALKGKAANEKGEVTLSRLIDYLETNVPKRVKYDKGEIQIPTANYSETYKANQLILAVVDKRTNNLVLTASSLPPSKITWSDFRGIAQNLLKYDEIMPFSGGLAWATYYNEGLYAGFINKTAEEFIPIKTADVPFLFSEDLAVINYDASKSRFILKMGKEAIPESNDRRSDFYTKEFSEGLAHVGTTFIDKNGKIVLQLKYDDASSFSEGLAQVKLNGKYGFINKTGKEIIRTKYDEASSFSGGQATVRLNGDYYFIDKKGEVISKLQYDWVGQLEEGVARVRIGNSEDGKYGLIDRTGKIVTPVQYDDMDSFSEGFALVEKNKKQGYINKEGKEITLLKYERVYDVCVRGYSSFSGGLATISVGDKIGFIDTRGSEVIAPKYDSVWCEAFNKEGFIGVRLNGKKGFVDIYGNEYFDL